MNYVVVGASAAGINGVKYIREMDPDANITLISKDEYIYSRCILHHYLEGIRDIKAQNSLKMVLLKKIKFIGSKAFQLKKLNLNKKS